MSNVKLGALHPGSARRRAPAGARRLRRDRRRRGGAASVVPADVAVYVSVDTSFEGDQWRAVRGLARRVPRRRRPAGDARWTRPPTRRASERRRTQGRARRPRSRIVVLAEPEPPGEPSRRGHPLTQPDDEDAFQRSSRAATAAVARGGRLAGRRRERGESLEPTARPGRAARSRAPRTFDEAMDDLDDDALARVYVNGAALLRGPAGRAGLPRAAAVAHALRAATASFGAGVRRGGRRRPHRRPRGRGRRERRSRPSPTRSELSRRSRPACSRSSPSTTSATASRPDVAAGTVAGRSFMPFDLDEVAALLSGETAVYVRARRHRSPDHARHRGRRRGGGPANGRRARRAGRR